MRISDWSSDVCSSDLNGRRRRFHWSLTASVRVWSAGGATLTGQVCYIQIEAWLEHRAEKWEPVFRLKRCDNKSLERATCIRFNAARSSGGGNLELARASPRRAGQPVPRAGAGFPGGAQTIYRNAGGRPGGRGVG